MARRRVGDGVGLGQFVGLIDRAGWFIVIRQLIRQSKLTGRLFGLAGEFFDHTCLIEARQRRGEKKECERKGEEPDNSVSGRARIDDGGDESESDAQEQAADTGALHFDRTFGKGQRRLGPVKPASTHPPLLTFGELHFWRRSGHSTLRGLERCPH